MKINGISTPHQAGQANGSRNGAQAAGTTAASDKAGPAAITHIKATDDDGSRDIDAARVAEIRQAISEGRLEFHADRIADKLIASVQDLLGQDDP